MIGQTIIELENCLSAMSASDFKHFVDEYDNGELEEAMRHLRLAISLLEQC